MASQAVYTDLAAARENAVAENVETIVETPDYFDMNVTPPGEYLTQARTIAKITNKQNGTTTFEIHLTGGVKDLTSGVAFGNGKYPFRKWLSTTLFEQNGKPGKTSQVSQYLREAGFDPKTLRSKQDVLDAMEASLNVPMKVYVGWRDKGVKQPDESYTDLKLKTKDFITGQREDGSPIYSPVITRDGVEVKATENIGSFRSFA